PADPGMGVEKERMAENGVGTEYADLVCPLDRRLAVAPDHLLHLVDALCDVHGKRYAALTRRLTTVTQKIGRAVLDLHRRDDAGEPPARMTRGTVDQRQRGGEAGPPAR